MERKESNENGRQVDDWEENKQDGEDYRSDKEENKREEERSRQLTSFDDKFLNRDDYTEEEINEYKKSLIHDEGEVKKRMESICRRKGRLNVLMIAEKPKIAQLISEILSRNRYQTEEWKGFKTYKFDNLKFKEFDSNFNVSSVYGNIYGVDYDENLNHWETNPLALLSKKSIYTYPVHRDTRDRMMKKNSNVNLEYLETHLMCYI